MQKYDISKIRNFSIIAHIDHGKSTLADRLMEETGTVAERDMKDRMLDTLELEQERGITIKLQTVRMNYKSKAGEEYILNLIDTPGHVDFSYEVSRSIAASEGAVLLVDATQGIQAQTLTTVYKALEYDLTIIPVVNKIDLPGAMVEETKQELVATFGFTYDEIIETSGKTGIGVGDLLESIVKNVPAPKALAKVLSEEPSRESLAVQENLAGEETHAKSDIQSSHNQSYTQLVNQAHIQAKALIFDSFYDEHKGVVALVKLVQGEIAAGKALMTYETRTKLEPIEIGYLIPKMDKQPALYAGEVGYIATGLKDIKVIHIGDTITLEKDLIGSDHDSTVRNFERFIPLPGYKRPKPMVFASLYPIEADEFEELAEALEKLALNDAALTVQRENSKVLGSGFVCGFLGLLHLEITQERLEREFDVSLITTTPTVEYKVQLTTKDLSKVPNVNPANIEGNTLKVRMAAEFPDPSLIEKIYEPWVNLEIVTPDSYIGQIMELAQKARGIYKSMEYVAGSDQVKGKKHVILRYEIPTAEIIINFFDKLKSITQGYASMDYEFLDYHEGDVVKVSVLINHEVVEALSFLTHRDSADYKGRLVAAKLKDIIPRQQFKVPVQAAIGGRVIARETIQQYSKDVTAKLYGGDISRKIKLREKQKKGKKRLKMFGKVEIPKEAFLEALKS